MSAVILPIEDRPAKSTDGRPEKPYPEFPLFPHATKRWAKKIRGKMHYFGPWDDPEGALNKYLDQKDDLYAGRVHGVQGDGLTVKDLAIQFLTSKKLLEESGDLSKRHYADCARTCEAIAKAFGSSRLVSDLGPEDFEGLRGGWVKKGWAPQTVVSETQRVRSLFKYAYDAGLVDKPIRFGPGFKRPSKKALRLARAAKGPQMFEANEINRLLKAAGVQLRAMILLGINCGYGNADCGTLPLAALDLKGGWVNYPRPKTGIDRRCPLWPETVKALKDAVAKRPAPKDPGDSGLVFITKYGRPWFRDSKINPLTHEMRKLLDDRKIDGQRNFYALRHTLRTVADECKDQPAVDHIMGHARDDMASVYRERISDQRLTDVVAHVHKWLFGKGATNASRKRRHGRRARK